MLVCIDFSPACIFMHTTMTQYRILLSLLNTALMQWWRSILLSVKQDMWRRWWRLLHDRCKSVFTSWYVLTSHSTISTQSSCISKQVKVEVLQICTNIKGKYDFIKWFTDERNCVNIFAIFGYTIMMYTIYLHQSDT